jgi:glycosyltransferase involved in cell wall biosynthesis
MVHHSAKLSALTVFFPAYNEQANIQLAVEQALEVVPKIADEFEIIVVNDGSTDQTLKIAQQLARQYSQVRVVTQDNQGYGGALKRGLNEAQYDWIFYTDSDLQFDLKELVKLVSHTQEHQLLIGYRLNRVEGWKRHILAVLLKLWNRVLLGFPSQIKDIDCAFKLMHRSVFDQIKPLVSTGAMISTELLLKVYRAGIPYQQVGVHHYPRQHGTPTGNKLQVILTAVKETLLLRQLLGYQPQAARQLEQI